MTSEKLAPLSEAQQEIMEIIWEHGELSVTEVRNLLTKHRELARNTVLTLIQRMHEKGWLKYREIGRTFLYSAIVPKKVSLGKQVIDLVDSAFGGSAEELMTALVDYRGLSKDEAARIRSIIDEAERNNHSGKKRG
jgi:predicted transcriptional regulator